MILAILLLTVAAMIAAGTLVGLGHGYLKGGIAVTTVLLNAFEITVIVMAAMRLMT